MATQKGFTLVEIIVVVIVLGVLAAIVVPHLTSASDDARSAALRDDLRCFRSQCEVYRFEHGGRAPGYPADGGPPSEATFRAQMLESTDIEGNVGVEGDEGVVFGPYLVKIPINPINGKATIRVLDDDEVMPAAASNQFGWIYQPLLVSFRSDSAGEDTRGEVFFDY